LQKGWSTDIWRLVLLLAAAALVGVVIGYPLVTLLIAQAGFIFWHLRELNRLERWLQNPERDDVPEAEQGLWGEIFDLLYRWRQRASRREQKLETLLSRFQQAASALPDAVVILRGDGTIEWVNKVSLRLLGISKKDVGQPVANLLRQPEFVAYFRNRDYSTPLNLDSPANQNLRLRVRIVPYGIGQKLLVARDVTRLQRLEDMRRDFVANISHEMRTPLTVITGYLESLSDHEKSLSEDAHKSIQLMQEQTTRMQHLVTDLLFLSRIETGPRTSTWEPVAVPAMLAAVREDAMALSGEEKHRISMDVDNSIWLRGNETEIRSAFSNLIFNAVRYTPPGGEISVRWFADKGGAHFSVSDSGIGIPSQHIPRLTERFYRVDTARSRERGGTGLGLAIVKHVLQRHDARLDIESAENQGSTFTCHFPRDNIIKQDAAVAKKAARQ
jgi:two-component system phosphate regulon sensor histidine kinase PhoR